MGIPKFYKWLRRRYPLIVGKVESEDDIPPIDNLYLDMNGLVHMVVHGNTMERHILTSQMVYSGHTEELWCEIFRYIDELVHLVGPRKLLFLALDSVTPVAKMTQQRARRLRDAKSLRDMDELAKQNDVDKLFDLNAISPGTEFMGQLNEKIDFFLQKKVTEDPFYQRIKIIFSNSNIPGEGEHKIMEFLRHYKHSPEYDPNARHCVYGLDADLIMLALVSHEPHMIILREIVEQQSLKAKSLKGINRPVLTKRVKHEILYVSVLREYFEIEYSVLKPKLPFKFDLERIIDDFIFFSLFVGNDFVPYLYTIDINYGSLDEIIRIYKEVLPEMGDYVTLAGEIQWSCAEKIFKRVGQSELSNFQARLEESNQCLKSNDKTTKNIDKAKILLEKKKLKVEQLKANGKLSEYKTYLRAKQDVEKEDEGSDLDPNEVPDSDVSLVDEDMLSQEEEDNNEYTAHSIEANREFLQEFCGAYRENVTEAKRLYYKLKFQFDINEEEGKKSLDKLIYKYLEGLQWVIYYYYRGVKHWGWYYSYHYAPLVSDISSPQNYFKEGGSVSFDYLEEPNKPVTPFEQLLCILPDSSKKLLPVAYHSLYGANSEIFDLYPRKFELDFNGRVLPWEAIKIIPFVDLCRVLEAEKRVLAEGPKFTEEEKKRNTIQTPYQYIYLKSAKCKRVQSNLPDFPSLETSTCLKQEFHYLPLPPGKSLCFLPELDSDIELPCFDFPSLKNLEIETFALGLVEIKEVVYDCIELNLKEPAVPEYKDLLTNSIYIGYPFQHEARVDAIITKTNLIAMNKDGTKVITHACKNSQAHFKNAVKNLVEGKLICQWEPKFICYCRPLDHIAKDYMEGGVYKKVFSSRKLVIHCGVIMLKRNERHYLNINRWLETPFIQYPSGANCVLLAEPYFGAVGQIAQSFPGSGSISCILRQSVKKDIVTDLLSIASGEDLRKDFMPMRKVAIQLGISLTVLNRIISTVIVVVEKKGVDIKNAPKYNVGLVLRKQSEGINIAQHIFFNENYHNWMFSPELVNYLLEYTKRYPLLFELLTDQENKRIYERLTAASLFPETDDPESSLKALLAWIMSLPISKLPFVPSSSQTLPQKSYISLQEKLHKNTGINPELILVNSRIKEVFVEINPFWVRPFGNKSYSEYQVGDRVINIKTSGLSVVPFGYSGTIIGIYLNKVMIEFDKPLITGSSFNGACRKFCGILLDSHSVLNVSMKRRSAYKQPVAQGQRNYSKNFAPPTQYYQGQRPNYQIHPRPRAPGPRGDSNQFYAPQIRVRKH